MSACVPDLPGNIDIELSIVECDLQAYHFRAMKKYSPTKNDHKGAQMTKLAGAEIFRVLLQEKEPVLVSDGVNAFSTNRTQV